MVKGAASPGFGVPMSRNSVARRPFTSCAVDDVGGLVGATDPLLEMIDVELVGHDDLRLILKFYFCTSPMPGTAP